MESVITSVILIGPPSFFVYVCCKSLRMRDVILPDDRCKEKPLRVQAHSAHAWLLGEINLKLFMIEISNLHHVIKYQNSFSINTSPQTDRRYHPTQKKIHAQSEITTTRAHDFLLMEPIGFKTNISPCLSIY